MLGQDLTASRLRPHLQRCGYRSSLLIPDVDFGQGTKVALVGFSHTPADVRSACIAVIDAATDPVGLVLFCRGLGAPVVFVCYQGQLQWWKQRSGAPDHIETVPASKVANFFDAHASEFAPHSIYRAKSWGFERDYQLTFVDIGLMPLVESEIGERLGNLIERNVSTLKSNLGWKGITPQQGQWLLNSVFWLVSGKILRDKQVSDFSTVDLRDVDDLFRRVAQHYGTTSGPRVHNRSEREALRGAAATISQFSHLGHVTAESLAYVYENTLVEKQARRQLGIHSTPSYLVDYVVGRTAPWINEIPLDDRNVFEPACGHAAFLVSAMRLLRELLPSSMATHEKGRAYLRKRLHGCDVDPFALETARLSLTLADIPNPDDWDLQHADMFTGQLLEQQSREATILLANAPFESFTAEEKANYLGQGTTLRHSNKTGEMLRRTLPCLRPGAAFGVVVPQGLLHSKSATELRSILANECDLEEICLFPDKVFTFSDAESAIIIGRKATSRARSGKWELRYGRVRERDVQRFKRSYVVATKYSIDQSRFCSTNAWDMWVPDLEEVWRWCYELAKLESLAVMGQGLFYKGAKNLPQDAITFSERRFPRAIKGFVRFDSRLQTHQHPREMWMNLDPAVLDRTVTGATRGVPQVLLNYARVTRGPWRLKALIDADGHPVTSRFITVRPREGQCRLEYLWAVCNSPLANAYAYAHLGKRDNLVGVLRRTPVPAAAETRTERIVDAAKAYLDAVSPDPERPGPQITGDTCRELLLRMDAEVLRLYELPPRLERQLLDLFAGWPRPGVPCQFDRYFPEDFQPCFPLHEYLSDEYQRSTAGALRARHEKVASSVLLAALEEAVEAFAE